MNKIYRPALPFFSCSHNLLRAQLPVDVRVKLSNYQSRGNISNTVTPSFNQYQLYLLVIIKSTDVSFFAFSWLLASHLYVPLSSLSTLPKTKIASSFPVLPIVVLSLYQVTFAGG